MKELLELALKFNEASIEYLKKQMEIVEYDINRIETFKELVEKICEEYDLKTVLNPIAESEFEFNGSVPPILLENGDTYYAGFHRQNEDRFSFVFVGNLNDENLSELKELFKEYHFGMLEDVSEFFNFYCFRAPTL